MRVMGYDSNNKRIKQQIFAFSPTGALAKMKVATLKGFSEVHHVEFQVAPTSKLDPTQSLTIVGLIDTVQYNVYSPGSVGR